MYGLPGQTPENLDADLDAALDAGPAHLSIYQLTLEPGTPFYHRPPKLPDEGVIDEMLDCILQKTGAGGYRRYEVSAYAQPERKCRHNRNYWLYGDYIGVGPGAHGKISTTDALVRREKIALPRRYLSAAVRGNPVENAYRVLAPDRVFEFLLNALRLVDGFPIEIFRERTGQDVNVIADRISDLVTRGLLQRDADRIACTPAGYSYLDDILQEFLPSAEIPDRAANGRVKKPGPAATIPTPCR